MALILFSGEFCMACPILGKSLTAGLVCLGAPPLPLQPAAQANDPAISPRKTKDASFTVDFTSPRFTEGCLQRLELSPERQGTAALHAAAGVYKNSPTNETGCQRRS